MRCFQPQSGSLLAPCISMGKAAVFLLVFIPISVYAVVSPWESSRWWAHYSQGWPLVYLKRQVDTTVDKGVWFLWSGVIHFSPLMMAANIAVAALVALAVTSVWCLHTAKRPWWQFSLRELLCLVTVSAVALSYCCLPIVQQRREKALSARLEKMGWFLGGSASVRPNWMMRPLVDLGIVSPSSFWRVGSVDWQGRYIDRITVSSDGTASHHGREETADDFLDETGRLLARLKYCDEIHVCGSSVTDRGIESLCANWSNCRSADFYNSSGFTDTDLNRVVESWPDLEELDLSRTAVSDRGLQALARLPRLSVLSIMSMDRNRSQPGLVFSEN